MEIEVVEWIPAFLLVLVRVSAFMLTLPFFSYQTIPQRFKIGFAGFLAWIMIFNGDWPVIELNYTFILLVIKEALVGLTVGLIALLLLYAIQVAGGLIDLKLGFLIANVVDPQTGTQAPLIGTYLYTFALLFLLATNAHHLLLDGVYYSYEFIPLDQAFLPFGNEDYAEFIGITMNTMFIIAFQMSMPIMGSIFLVDVALGFIARTVPQVNVFVVGFPLKIFLGFIFMLVTMPVFFVLVNNLIETIMVTMRTLMQLYGGV
ncbi:flagellar biosynthetic protein FliR [Salisediminibacterium beveridgei]|uniref:Flagellar biosynthetic protein FliR n=1 Tax=Salisediminibacterium beveridgei TaxID=632773 RepID=A0A1D7QVY8_9BACI|nr:flagellar biosynthetic protein FliR [Salisediminibacterium beveridgei]AOM83172.1 Flagellar biosynthesis protein FliR [Salisediminibacterium beveridgei]